MSTAIVNGVACSYASVELPSWGIWRAVVRGVSEEALAPGDAVTLTLADLVLVGTVARGGRWDGSTPLLIVGGAGGWSRVAKAKGYRNGAGVKLGKVAGDLAFEVGETLDTAYTDRVVGSGYVRRAGPAATSMHELAPLAWWVGEDGVTRLGARPSSSLDLASGALLTRRREDARVLVASLELASILPGKTLDGDPIVHVTHELSGSSLRSHLLMGVTS